MTAQEQYEQQFFCWSDVRPYLPTLRSKAKGSVLELGSRGGASTIALLAGVEANGGHVWSVDIDEQCGKLFQHPQWTFIWCNSMDEMCVKANGGPNKLDLLFLDTLHDYWQVSNELDIWGDSVKPGGCILVHDTLLSNGARSAVNAWAVQNGYMATFRTQASGMGIIEIPEED